MDHRPGKRFKEIVNERVSQYQKDFERRLEDEYSLPLLNDEHNKIQNQLTTTYNSNPKFNAIFHDLYEQSRRKKGIQHIDLCEEYCTGHQLSYEETVLFFPTLFYLHEIDRWILDQKQILEEMTEEEGIQLKERNEGEFTITRRILATYFLFRATGVAMNANKTRIAEFTQFLVSKESNPKNIRDTQIYSRVKKLWNREDLMHIDDLVYVAQEFKEVGLNNIVQAIDRIINKKQSKEI